MSSNAPAASRTGCHPPVTPLRRQATTNLAKILLFIFPHMKKIKTAMPFGTAAFFLL